MNFEVVFSKSKTYSEKDLYSKLVNIFGPENVSRTSIDKFAYSKDYTLITTRWTLDGKLAAIPDFIVWPTSVQQISQFMKLANEIKAPVIPFGAGSGVVGGAIPIHGGIIVDMKKMDQILSINETNLTVTIQTGKNGMNLERELNHKGFTLGHIPQSIYTSTLGGYINHRAAGQFSTKYGKIEDMILSFEAVLPAGEIVYFKASPRNSVGPQVDRLLIGSEGTLAIITRATLRIWPKPSSQVLLSYAFPTIEQALLAVREILQSQAYPAVIRIYDKEETKRHFPSQKKAKKACMVIFVCEGNEKVVNTEKDVVSISCIKNDGIDCGVKPVNHWFKSRFDVTETSIYPPIGIVPDTIEVSCMWDLASKIYHEAIQAMKAVDGTIVATGHASHFYPQGVCFYFTFAGKPLKKTDWDYYRAVWDACIKSVVENGGSISHHHGIGINRGKWMEKEWGSMFPLLKKLKKCLDPNNILNPGKLYEGSLPRVTKDEED
jgi:alkyldihydroxyacetonephosphate synthase